MSHLCLDEEKALLSKIAGGDETAFRIVFNQYYRLLGAHILRITKSQEIAEEVVQDVFLKIWMSRETLSSIQDFRAYLYVVSRNHALNCLKKVAREGIVQGQTNWVDLENRPFPEETGELDYYSLIDEAIDSLPPQQQKVYLLSRHEHLRYHEIASHLNLSRETVKKYLQIATESITAYIKKRIVTGVFVFFSYFF